MGPDCRECSIFLALGSNLGDRQGNIEKAYEEIEKRVGRIVMKSTFYHSSPKGFESPNRFINSACKVISRTSLNNLLSITQSIEHEMGREDKKRREVYADRVIDIDLLLAGNKVINSPGLIVPHPRMHERDFVLVPLCEIAPNIIHPILGKTIRELMDLLPRQEN